MTNYRPDKEFVHFIECMKHLGYEPTLSDIAEASLYYMKLHDKNVIPSDKPHEEHTP